MIILYVSTCIDLLSSSSYIKSEFEPTLIQSQITRVIDTHKCAAVRCVAFSGEFLETLNILKTIPNPGSESLLYKKDRTNILPCSCDTVVQSRGARSGDSSFPQADPGARTCEVNHTVMWREFWAQCSRVRRCKEDLNTRSKLWPSNDSGIRIVNWKPQSKTPPEYGRRTHLLYLIYSYYIRSHV